MGYWRDLGRRARREAIKSAWGDGFGAVKSWGSLLIAGISAAVFGTQGFPAGLVAAAVTLLLWPFIFFLWNLLTLPSKIYKEQSSRIVDLERQLDNHKNVDPRLLTQEQVDKIDCILRTSPRGEITVTRVSGSGESAAVERQMRGILRKHGWHVTYGAHTMDSENRPPSGLIVTTTSERPTLPEIALLSALDTAGVAYELKRNPYPSEKPFLQMVFTDTDTV